MDLWENYFSGQLIVDNLQFFLSVKVPHATFLFAAPGVDVLIVQNSTSRLKIKGTV